MGIKGVTRLLLASLTLFPAAVGWGAEIHGRSSTQFMWYNNEFVEERQFEAAQYLRFGITDIDKDKKFSLYGYGRLAQDFTNGEGLTGRLYYLYGDYKGLYDKADLRLGRQFVNSAAGNAIIDGLWMDLKNVGPVAFTAFGGRDVVFGLDGELGYSWNSDYGIAAYLYNQRNTDLEVSWFRKLDKSYVARDTLGVSAKQYLFNNIRLYGNARYDMVAEAFSETLGGIKYYPTSDLIFTGEYFRSYPTFDTTSIFSVFAVDKYEEAVFRADYTLNEKVSVNCGYNREWFDEGASANVYKLGAKVHLMEPLRLTMDYENRNGYGGSLNGGSIDADYEITKQAQVAGGFLYNVYRRDQYDVFTHEKLDNNEIARTFWLGGKYKVTKAMAVSGRVQNENNEQYGSNVTGRLVLDYDF